MTARFVVGIDLGTTHTVVAFAAIDPRRTKTAPEPTIFPITQRVTGTEREARELLPSCLYAPIAGEIVGDPQWVSGELARRRGAEVTSRFVASAKSWLSHGAVDRLAPILPWAQAEEPKISPVEASARYLADVRAAWDEAHPDAPLAEQEVIVTIPASFDEVARELTVKAAEIAGLAPTLIEEPTAAFYDAMRDVDAMREHLEPAARGELARASASRERVVLICDVGGGTTDLSLVAIAPAPKAKGGFVVRRVAVGRHILLGGDNMDLALAHAVEPRLGGSLEPSELAQLVQSCRGAKERLLGKGRGRAESATVTVLGRGAKLVGGARSATIERADLDRLVVEGFFPRDVAADPPKRGAIVAFGLPYERDPAITRHVREFLTRHAKELPHGGPDVVLLNGGVFKAKPIASALLDALASWGTKPALLENPDPELAVARGAVRYAFARRGVGVRVESGAARGYYVGLPDNRAVCILPRGAAESVRHDAGRTFELVVGRSVRFDLHASDVARDESGVLVTLDETVHERLPPLVTRIEGKEGTLRVLIGAELLPTGQLELTCESEGGKRHRLEFQLREGARSTSLPPPASIAPPSISPRTSAAPGKLGDALAVLEHVFGKRADAEPRAVKDVVRDLEKILGDRAGWTMETARGLADRLLANPGARRRSAHHERAFFMLLGFCLRPGFGDPGDPVRIARVAPFFEGRLGFPDEPQGWQQLFIAWRRMAGGFDESGQVAIRDAMDPVIAPRDAGLKPPKRMPEHTDELVTMLASLERVPIARRVVLGDWLVEKTWTDPDPRLWTALGRIGARVPLYASLHHVVPPRAAEAWLERLLRAKWEAIPTAPHAAVQLARVTGDRARDVTDRLRKEAAKRLAAAGAKEAWIRAVSELVEVGEEERVAMLGEGLPIGLRLLT